jgi:hypothetical protein
MSGKATTWTRAGLALPEAEGLQSVSVAQIRKIGASNEPSGYLSKDWQLRLAACGIKEPDLAAISPKGRGHPVSDVGVGVVEEDHGRSPVDPTGSQGASDQRTLAKRLIGGRERGLVVSGDVVQTQQDGQAAEGLVTVLRRTLAPEARTPALARRFGARGIEQRLRQRRPADRQGVLPADPTEAEQPLVYPASTFRAVALSTALGVAEREEGLRLPSVCRDHPSEAGLVKEALAVIAQERGDDATCYGLILQPLR